MIKRLILRRQLKPVPKEEPQGRAVPTQKVNTRKTVPRSPKWAQRNYIDLRQHRWYACTFSEVRDGARFLMYDEVTGDGLGVGTPKSYTKAGPVAMHRNGDLTPLRGDVPVLARFGDFDA